GPGGAAPRRPIPRFEETSPARRRQEFLAEGQTAFGDALPPLAADSSRLRDLCDTLVAYRGLIGRTLPAIAIESRITIHDMQTFPFVCGSCARTGSRRGPRARATRWDGRQPIRTSLRHPLSGVAHVRRVHLLVSGDHGAKDADARTAEATQRTADVPEATEGQVSTRVVHHAEREPRDAERESSKEFRGPQAKEIAPGTVLRKGSYRGREESCDS